MACISVPTAILGAGALNTGASLFGASNASSAALQAAKLQSGAANLTAAGQAQIYRDMNTNLEPYREVGKHALLSLEALTNDRGNPLTSPLTSPLSTTFAPTQAQLEQTPGYQFVLSQGRNAVSNQLAASGLAGSGAAGKAQTNYAEGLAGTTFQQQFQNWLTQQNLNLSQRQQIYNMLGGLSTTGQNASTMTGSLGIQSGAQIGNSITGAAAAGAGGIVGSANALNAGISGTSGAASNTALLLALNNSGMFGTPAAGGGGAGGTGSMFPDFNWRGGG